MLDANFAIGLSHLDTDVLKTVLKVLADKKHGVLMPRKVLNETVRYELDLYKTLTGHSNFVSVDVPDAKFDQVRSDCRGFKRLDNPHDYHVICVADMKKADFIVSNDRALRIVAREYFDSGKGSIQEIGILHIAEFASVLYKLAADDFNLMRSVNLILDYYDYNEIPRIPEGVKLRQWDEKTIKEMFAPYKSSVYSCVGEICR